jgi:hypothetical protein
MSYLNKILPAVALLISLAPYAAYARRDVSPSAQNTQTLVAIPGSHQVASNIHGRAAEFAYVTPTYMLSGDVTQYASNSKANSVNTGG